MRERSAVGDPYRRTNSVTRVSTRPLRYEFLHPP